MFYTIDPGEGFWVNVPATTTTTTVALTTTTSTTTASTTTTTTLPSALLGSWLYSENNNVILTFTDTGFSFSGTSCSQTGTYYIGNGTITMYSDGDCLTKPNNTATTYNLSIDNNVFVISGKQANQSGDMSLTFNKVSVLFSDSFDSINTSLWNYSSSWNYSEAQTQTAPFKIPAIVNGALAISTSSELSLAADEDAYFGLPTSSAVLVGDFILKIRVGERNLVTTGNNDYSGSLQFRLEDTTDWSFGTHIMIISGKAHYYNTIYDYAGLEFRKNGQNMSIGGNLDDVNMFMTEIQAATGDTNILTLLRNGTTFTALVGDTVVGSIPNVTTSDLHLTLNPHLWNAQAGSVQSFTAGIEDIRAYHYNP